MKGFTLIELLAVIVILAVIALIATPIVLSIINDTKEQAVVRSAEFYVNAVENKIMQENMKLGGKLNPKECIVGTDGNVTCDGTPLEIEVNGDKPDSGIITFDRGRVTGITLTFGERKVVTDVNGELVLEDNAKVCMLISGEANTIGSKYECEVKSRTKFNFYVLSHEEDGTTNLIMDRNICEDGSLSTSQNTCTVAWIIRTDYENAGGQYWDDWEDNNNYGPVTAMNYLNAATSDWSNIPNLNITYNDEDGNFTNFQVTGKARLPYHREVNEVGCENYSVLSCPIWMVDYLYDAGLDYETTYQENPIDGIYGYWTFSSYAYDSLIAWYVTSSGYVYYNLVDDGSVSGVRPVINLKL